MLNKLPQLKYTLTPNSANPDEVIELINNYIDGHYCKEMSVDISLMNILDACHVTTLCSTQHYIKYPDGRITWKVSSESVREFSQDLELGNSEYIL